MKIGIDISKKELRLINNARNKCMHFRVMTKDEYIKIVNTINKYTSAKNIRESIKALELISSHELLNHVPILGGCFNDIITPVTIQEIADNMSRSISSTLTSCLNMSITDWSKLANTGIAIGVPIYNREVQD